MSEQICLCPYCREGNCSLCQKRTSHAFKLREHGLITSEYDILKLNIIDFNRLNGSWSNPGDALRTIASWFVNLAHYTIIETDLRSAPERSDFPGWKHAGNHEYYGLLFWNWWNCYYKGELIFSDAPDFFGTFHFSNGEKHRFWGDIGQVSAQAFALTQKQMQLGDIWISLLGEERQIIIEPMVSLFDIASEQLAEDLGIK